MSSKAKTLARRLLRENRGTRSKEPRSWRAIASEDFHGRVSHATICRFALSGGEWLPKNEDLQIALGVKKPRKQKAEAPRDLFDMATDTLRQALHNRTEMPPVDKRIIREFQKLGWIKRTRK